MNYWDDGHGERLGLTLTDVLLAVDDEDAALLRGLMAKAIERLDVESDELLTKLQNENAQQKQRILALIGERDAKAKALSECHREVTEMRLAMSATDAARALELLTENETLKATVAAQRAVIARLEMSEGRKFILRNRPFPFVKGAFGAFLAASARPKAAA